MGVSFNWGGGGASYPRYYEEVEAIATKCFGATLNPKFVEDAKQVEKSLVNPTYMFGKVHDRPDKFIFPEGTPEAIVAFCRKPVDECYEPKPLWDAFQQHPEIEEISYQIWEEVRCCAIYGELYHVW